MRALFLEREGTLIVNGAGNLRDPADVQVQHGVIEALLDLQRTFKLVIVSNQDGISEISEPEARAVHERVMSIFLRAGVGFAGAFYCPHARTPAASAASPRPAC